jgi:hypothetical protein
MPEQQQFVKSLWPTRKWWVGVVTAVAALLTNILQSDHWSRDFGVAVVAVVAGAISSYLIPNSDNPGGYEAKAADKPAVTPSPTPRAAVREVV